MRCEIEGCHREGMVKARWADEGDLTLNDGYTHDIGTKSEGMIRITLCEPCYRAMKYGGDLIPGGSLQRGQL